MSEWRRAVTIQHFDPTTVNGAMKFLFASTLVAAAAIAGTAANAETSTSGDGGALQCSIGYVTGVGGAAASMREYLALPDRDRYRYLNEHPIECKVSDEGRASDCTGVTNLRKEKVSVYDDIDSTTVSVVARVELDHGASYPVIIVVPKHDVKCDE